MFIRVSGGRKKSGKFVATEGTITVTTNVSGASVKIESGSSVKFSQDMNGYSLTTPSLPNGDYTLTVSKEGYDTITKTITVKGDITEDITMIEKTGANAYVVNSLKEYKDTVLVNDNAIVSVNMRDKEGNPVANKVAVLTLGDATNSSHGSMIKVKGQVAATTDANGNATFVVGYEDVTGLKATSTGYVSSIKYTASIVGENATASGSISVAAINIGNVAVGDNIADGVKYGKLKAGTSAYDAGYKNGANDIAKTKNLSDEDAEYILTQQVSSKDVGRILRTFKIKKNVEVTDNGKIII
ncbi:MAG: PEGA domain-containing protein [Lachnospiraceae bacterium]|nr:PEGA domain-containing protein [Lachnospiraceae bacterium]